MDYFWQPAVAISLGIIIAALLIGVTLLWFSFRLARRAPAISTPTCPKCRYSMNGLQQLDCPECGHKVHSIGDWTRRPRRAMPIFLRVLAAPFLLYTLVMLWFVVAYTAHFVHVNHAFSVQPTFGYAMSDFWYTHRIAKSISIRNWEVPLDAITPLPWTLRVSEVHFEAAPSDDDLRSLVSLDRVWRVYIYDCSALTHVGLAKLKDVPALHNLDLYGPDLDESAMQSIADIPVLADLTVHDARTHGNAISRLAGARLMNCLQLEKAALGDDEMRALASAASLEYLSLRDCSIPAPALLNLDGTKSLTMLVMHGRLMNDEHVQCLAALAHSHLTELNLDETAVTDACIESLGRMSTLREVSLYDTRITDAGLNQLATYPKIKSITVGKTNCSQAAVDAINLVTPRRVKLER